MCYTFNDIFIGLPDGETEAKNELFEKLFCDYNNRYKELTSSSAKFLVVGSKGSGKTYLANYMCKQKQKKQYRKIVNAKDFLIESLRELPKENVDKGYMYAFCSWYLYKKLAEYIYELYPKKSTCCIFAKKYKLRKFYEGYNTENDFFSIENKTITKEDSSEAKNGISCVFTGEADTIFSATRDSNYEQTKGKRTEITYQCKKKDFFDLLNHFSEMVLNAVGNKEEICLILDDLDELDNQINANTESNITLNFIKAANEINGIFHKKGKNVKIILLVRSDIINTLQLYDMNLSKIKASCGVELYWLTNTQSSPEEHPLMYMILHKIRASCDKLSGYTDKELYNRLFPEKIDGKEPLNYLLDYSFGRPRDIVTYLNHVIEQYPMATAFTASSLKSVKKLYASDLYDEMLNQTFYYRKPEYTKDCLNLVSSMKKSSFTVAEVTASYEENKEMFKNIDKVEDALNYLYTMSVIGNTWDSGKKSSWSYRKDSLDEIDLTKKMTIHYGLRKKFAI